MNAIQDMLSGFEFVEPWALIGLLILPLIGWWLGKHQKVPSVPFPSVRGLKAIGIKPKRHQGWLRIATLLVCMALIIIAMAQPRVPRGDIPDPSKGIDIILALDYSGSMTEKDFHLKGRQVSRAAALAHVVENFIAKRPNDRIGIIGFAKAPYLVSPLTIDHEWVIAALHNIVQSRGTCIGEALVASTHFLRKASDRSKVIIVVSDGVNSEGRKPADVAPFVKKEGVRVYTIIIRPERLSGGQLRDHEMLKVSKLTGGQMFQATDTDALQNVYDMIDLLEKKLLTQKRYQVYNELFPWFIAAALALLAGHVVHQQLRRRIP